MSLRRLAIFVEGKTEQLFIERLIYEVAGRHNVRIESRKISGGVNVPRSVVTLKAAPEDSDIKFYVLIFDCQGDAQVKTRILEEHENLTRQGYSKIIGIRDVFPSVKREDISKLRTGLKLYLKGKLIPVEFVLSIMEIEAWFIAEFSHFERINPALSAKAILDGVGVDVQGDLSQLENPANDLKKIYSIVAIEYKKGTEITLDTLDYAKIYAEFPEMFIDAKSLMASLDDFLTE